MLKCTFPFPNQRNGRMLLVLYLSQETRVYIKDYYGISLYIFILLCIKLQVYGHSYKSIPGTDQYWVMRVKFLAHGNIGLPLTEFEPMQLDIFSIAWSCSEHKFKKWYTISVRNDDRLQSDDSAPDFIFFDFHLCCNMMSEERILCLFCDCISNIKYVV